MTMEAIIAYVTEYGSIIIFLALFCGIVGIPAPEESFLVLIGVMCVHNEFSLSSGVISAILGAFVGMVVAYIIGYVVGNKVVEKLGRYVGLNEERWHKAQKKYEENCRKTIILGLFLPGLRQINPYFAGATRMRASGYMLYSFIGVLIWAGFYIFTGYVLGQWFDIPLKYVSYLGFILLFIFISSIIVKIIKGKQVT